MLRRGPRGGADHPLEGAAEAAFELGHTDVAAGYMNTVRARAGLTTPLDQSEITFDRIVHERKVELAFEGHELWDMKRWRLAHEVWNGEAVDLSTNIGVANEVQTRVFGLWPYKYYDENGSDNNYKYVFSNSFGSQLLYTDQTLNITQDVLVGLNEKYGKSKE